MTPDELQRMAARGEEDGHDRTWMSVLAKTRRNLDLMLKAADSARDAAKRDEAAFVPTTKPPFNKP